VNGYRRALAKLLDRDRAWDEAEAERLLETLRSEPGAARLLKNQLLLDNLLSRRYSPERRDFINRVMQRLRGSEEANRFIKQTMSRRRLETGGGRTWRPVAMAMAVALGIGVVGLGVRERRQARAPEQTEARPALASETSGRAHPGRSIPTRDDGHNARIEQVEGEAFLVGHPSVTARPGATLQQGQALVTTGGDSAVTLTYGETSRVRLRGNSSLVPLGANQLFVSRGRIEAQVAGSPGVQLIFSSPHGQVVARQSKLALSVMDRTTRLDVEQGSVHFSAHRAGAAREISAGRYAQTTGGAEPVTGALAQRGRVALLTGSDNQTGVDATGLNSADRALKARLGQAGFEVQVILQGSQVEAEARQSTLMVISDSVSSHDFAENWLRALPVAVVVMEWTLFDDLGMTGPCGDNEECGFSVSPPGHLYIKDPHHPLAAGLTGTVKFSGKWVQLNWGAPTLSASWVANVPGYPMRATIFAYEQGAQMVGLAAPARRVALPIRGKAAAMLTDDGWALFDAAVQWCAEQPPL